MANIPRTKIGGNIAFVLHIMARKNTDEFQIRTEALLSLTLSGFGLKLYQFYKKTAGFRVWFFVMAERESFLCRKSIQYPINLLTELSLAKICL